MLMLTIVAPSYAIPNFEEATVIGDDVNMRLRPSTDSPFVLKLDKDTRIGVFSEEVPGWYRVIYGNYRGYISKDYVFLPSTDILVGNVLADETPVYQNAGEFSEVVGSLNAGVGVMVKSISGDYYLVEYSQEVKETSPSPSPSVSPSAQPSPTVQASNVPTPTAEHSPSPSPSATAQVNEGASPLPTSSSPQGENEVQTILTSANTQAPPKATEETNNEEETPVDDGISAQTPAQSEDFTDTALETEGDVSTTHVQKTGYVAKDAIKLSASKQAANLLKEGMQGAEVVKMQRELKERGFLDASATGEFGEKTKLAISLFQRKANLPEDGIAGPKTLEMLYGDNDIKITFAERMGLGGEVKLLPWSEAQHIFSKGTTAKITDVKTGISWNAKRFGGWFHADSEPVTAEDTAKMKKAYGGSWSWDRRAVWITVDGVTMAGSINGMPHLSWTINNNNFKGHHCIHLYQSKVHQTSAQCPRHQAAVQYAYKMGNQ